MSVSLVAVFIPILAMGGIIGRLFREFAVTLSVAIMISLVVTLATTPMMCALLLGRTGHTHHGRLYRASEWFFTSLQRGYERSLSWARNHSFLVFMTFVATLCLNFYLFVTVPKGFFPQQDTGRLNGSIQADQSISFQLMRQKLQEFIAIIRKDPAVDVVVGFTGGAQTNSGSVFISLKPLSERKISADQVIRRLRRELAQVAGASLFLQAVQDIRIGGRAANAQYQFTLQADDTDELLTWAPKILAELQNVPQMTEVNTDQQNKGLETDITIDRDTAARLGLNVALIDNTLYDAFGQRQVSTIYNPRNQYHVVMEVAPKYWQNAETLKDVFVSTAGGSASGTQTTNAVAGTVYGPSAPAARTCPAPALTLPPTPSATPTTPSTPTTPTTPSIGAVSSNPSTSSSPGTSAAGCGAASTSSTTTAAAVAADAVRNQALNSIGNTGNSTASTGSAVSTNSETMIPLSAVTHFGPGNIPLAVNHQGLAVATTISFNLAPGAALSDAVREVNAAMNRLGVPASLHGTFQGTARAFEQSIANEPYLVLAAVIAVYIVLGILYESYIHPITILSTLPSAGVGAVLALMLFQIEFSVIGLIGVILLIGIVKKNAIMMIDFALAAERSRGLTSQEAIFEASLLRLRPIMMTTAAAMLGAMRAAGETDYDVDRRVLPDDRDELLQFLSHQLERDALVSLDAAVETSSVLLREKALRHCDEQVEVEAEGCDKGHEDEIYIYLDRFGLWLRAFRARGSDPAAHGSLVPGE
jgi:multidrug efflux pump